jgi:hypothetical protein
MCEADAIAKPLVDTATNRLGKRVSPQGDNTSPKVAEIRCALTVPVSLL